MRQRAEESGAAYHTTDFQRILEDEAVDAELISSAHDTHAGLALQARAGGGGDGDPRPVGGGSGMTSRT